MNDFVNAAEAPEFDTARIVRGARRKRATVIAGIATALIVAGGGTALATINSGPDSDTSKPAAMTTATAAAADTTLLYKFDDGATLPIDMGGWSQETVRVQFLKMRVKGEYTKAATGSCKPGSVIGVSPHSPQTVDTGDTVKVTLCAG
ncbi:hypothetical protein ACFZCY_10480 [Streptomyces sp. NPDC007983]|uniref:hypothetical protein n=1 Tax=Streptomyces sp. NPDC007983 TaxID=3364800 RepID=UPI0036E5EA71